jgi:hypothetical protein
MEQKATTKEVDKSQDIANCRKSISEITMLLKEEVRLLMALFDKLTMADKNLVGTEVLEVLEKSERMIHDISRNLKIPTDKIVNKNLFPNVLK